MSRQGGGNTPRNTGGMRKSYQIEGRCSFSRFAKAFLACESGRISTAC